MNEKIDENRMKNVCNTLFKRTCANKVDVCLYGDYKVAQTAFRCGSIPCPLEKLLEIYHQGTQ